MRNVLIAEDDIMLAHVTEHFLNESGYIVCGIARTVSDAVELGRYYRPKFAIIDMQLADDDLGTDIAADLVPFCGVGVLYSTGDKAQVIKTATHGHACIDKPYHADDLLRCLELVEEIIATGAASPPFPPRFYRLSLSPRGA